MTVQRLGKTLLIGLHAEKAPPILYLIAWHHELCGKMNLAMIPKAAP
jgi:hypothetical protein